MNKLTQATLVGLFAVCPFASFAGAELDAVNAEVEAKAQQIDNDHGVLLTGQERNDLKIKLVAAKVASDLTQGSGSVTTEVNKAVETYEITDPADQRKLLIETESMADADGDGIEPPKQ